MLQMFLNLCQVVTFFFFLNYDFISIYFWRSFITSLIIFYLFVHKTVIENRNIFYYFIDLKMISLERQQIVTIVNCYKK